jgi:hypothetical protein
VHFVALLCAVTEFHHLYTVQLQNSISFTLCSYRIPSPLHCAVTEFHHLYTVQLQNSITFTLCSYRIPSPLHCAVTEFHHLSPQHIITPCTAHTTQYTLTQCTAHTPHRSYYAALTLTSVRPLCIHIEPSA